MKLGVFVLAVVCCLLCTAEEDRYVSPALYRRPTYSLFQSTPEVVDLAVLDVQKAFQSSAVAQCPWLVYLYDDGCGHCRSTAPTLTALAQESAGPDSNVSFVVFGSLNCAEFPDECVRQDVLDVPRYVLLVPRGANGGGKDTKWLGDLEVVPLDNSEKGLTKIREQLNEKWSVLVAELDWSERKQEHCGQVASYFHEMKRQWSADFPTEKTKFVEETKLYFADIANAFFYTMYHEVTAVKEVHGESRVALLNFLRLVKTALPHLRSDPLYEVVRSSDHISDALWRAQVLQAAIPIEGSPQNMTWRTCRGSAWMYRGFPCGLWLLYHALSVNSDPNTSDVLLVIKEYARFFFNCRPCREHFMRFKPDKVSHPVLQLWRVHNVVNHHLAKVTEGADPLVPKVFFPSKELCPHCYKDGEAVDEDKVLSYLKQRYGRDNMLGYNDKGKKEEVEFSFFFWLLLIAVAVSVTVLYRQRKRRRFFSFKTS
ncbi:quiescin sulfhydryl oxidase [Angomonas deanei]|nr:quiescin sulfhydryl oxidase [Angomonas deanei]|eukprot:EPY36424.1 quiescin sulfhydryl oxidase [Angomonas deanei]